MARPTKVCPSCNGLRKVRVLTPEEAELYSEEWIPCDQCGGQGVIPISDSELLDKIWSKLKDIERKTAWDPR